MKWVRCGRLVALIPSTFAKVLTLQPCWSAERQPEVEVE